MEHYEAVPITIKMTFELIATYITISQRCPHQKDILAISKLT
jgi:hypothetical protein